MEKVEVVDPSTSASNFAASYFGKLNNKDLRVPVEDRKSFKPHWQDFLIVSHPETDDPGSPKIQGSACLLPRPSFTKLVKSMH